MAFTGLGVTGAVIPAALPGLAERLSVETASLSPAVSALFLGLFVGVALTPLAAHHVGASRGAAMGSALQGASLLSMAFAGTTMAVVIAAFVSGVGFGAVEASGAVLSREVQEGTSRTLTGLMATTASAASLTPLVVVAAGSGLAYVLAAAVVPHVLALLLLVRTGHTTGSAAAGLTSDATSWRPRSATWLAAAACCYVGSETVVAGWSAVLPQASFELSSSQAAAGTSTFWALLMLGRLAALAALRHGASTHAVQTVCQLSAALTLTSAALVGQHRSPVSIVLVGLAVFCMGPCYALILGAAMNGAAEQNAARVARRLVAIGALGGAIWAGAVASAGPVGATTVATAAAAGMAASLLFGKLGG